ncbi:sugar ABC transporter permease [Oceanispirochaeta crateris]|uniref:Sugar ABC transporter permease n=1 Tax=Oceanispirochaeta crateris TaxID=2518645 RepID=A0A5C1QGQ1_9SPIO|nr:sugar ABC transporter permease [Oceanispirochaeta crateris]QEN06731.1 sugar ABC transporter permease [Oceanispirochaeta crateris]
MSNHRHIGLVWLGPMVVFLFCFYLFPLVDVIRLSLTNTTIGQNNFSYTLNSFISVLTDKNLPHILMRTLTFVFFSVFFQLLLGLLIGLLLEMDLHGAILLKMSMIFAWVVPGIITGIIWEILYSTSDWGLVNNIIQSVTGKKIPFLFNARWAIIGAIIANVWRGTGFSGLMQYAALKGINPQLYEAARIDGAGQWKIFSMVTLPLLKPMMLINIVLITIGTMNTYDSIWALTRGGPGSATTVLALQTYRATFEYLSLGQGAVYALLMVLSSSLLTLMYMKLLGSKES